MTRVDINGNTVSTNTKGLRQKIRNAKTYITDSAGRYMVDDDKGGYVVFFAQDEPELASWVEEHLCVRFSPNLLNPQP